MTKIEWTDRTWNPIAGCTPISPGCANCYAATMARRLAAMAQANIHKGRKPGRKRKYIGTAERRGHVDVFTGQIGYDDTITEPLMWTKPSKVFVNSESDLFHEAVPFEFIYRVLAVIGASPKHTFQVLTKRAARMAEFFADRSRVAYGMAEAAKEMFGHGEVGRTAGELMSRWPMRNLWLGVSVEDQQRADERIPHLLTTPAAVRFLSCEPLLGPVDLSAWMEPVQELLTCRKCGEEFATGESERDGLSPCCLREGDPQGETGGSEIGWLIAGGESGPLARPAHPDWFRKLRDQCQEAGVPYFFKQWGNWLPHSEVFPNGQNGEGLYATTQKLPRSMAVKTVGDIRMLEVGKKASGRFLDGREHSEFPRVEVPA